MGIRACEDTEFCSVFVRSSIFSLYIIFLTAVVGSCIFVTTITTDNAHCRLSEVSSSGSKMDELEDACGSLLDEPTSVVSSAAVSNTVPVFRPFLLGTGYC